MRPGQDPYDYWCAMCGANIRDWPKCECYRDNMKRGEEPTMLREAQHQTQKETLMEARYEGLALQVDDLATRLHKLTMEVHGREIPRAEQVRHDPQKETIMEARTIDFGGIGWAVNHMRHGHRLRRAGWNASNLWVGYVDNVDLAYPTPSGELLPIRPMLVMKTAQDELVAWLASQSDLLAADWEVVDAPQPGHTSAA